MTLSEAEFYKHQATIIAHALLGVLAHQENDDDIARIATNLVLVSQEQMKYPYCQAFVSGQYRVFEESYKEYLKSCS